MNDKDIKIDLLPIRKARGIARLAGKTNLLLLNNIAMALVKPISEYYKVGIDSNGYQRRIYLIPSDEPTGDPIKFHGKNRIEKPRHLYTGTMLYKIKGFNLGEVFDFVVEIKKLPVGDEIKNVIVLTEVSYQTS